MAEEGKAKVVKRAAPRKTVNAANLAHLGADRLAALLIEVADGQAGIKRRLKLALAGEVGAADLAVEIDKRVEAIGDSRARINWRKYKEFVRDLDAHRAAAGDQLGELDPVLAMGSLARIVMLSEALEGRINDTKGEVAQVFEAAIADVARLAPLAKKIDSKGLGETLLSFLLNASSRLSVELLRAAAPALDAATVGDLRARLGKRLADQRRPDPRLRAAAQVLADLQGDVDGYLALVPASQQVLPPVGAQIALRLLAAGRIPEAIAALEASAPAENERAGSLTIEWDEARIVVLEAAGDQTGAQFARWASFKTTLSPDMLRAFVKRLPDFEDVEAEDQALAYALAFPDPHRALAFLTAWPSAENAARLVAKRGPALHGDRPEVLEPAARLLEHRHPVAATILLRAMIDDVVRHGRTERYAAARTHLLEAESLVPSLPADAPFEDHETYRKRIAAYRRL